MPRVKRKKTHSYTLSSALLGAAALAFLFLVIKNSALSATLTLSALTLCGKTLIPALFPSAVAARVLAESGALRPIATPLDKFSRKVFGIGGEALAVALTGIICGFPTGAVGAGTLFKKGRINRNELLVTAVLSGTPSLSFLVFAVGERGFKDRNFGFFLFFTSVISSAAVTFAYARLTKKNEDLPSGILNSKKSPHTLMEADALGAKTLTAAVSSSALDIIRVCAFVIFFSVAAGLAEASLASLPLPESLLSAALGCLEITGGMTRAATLPIGGRIAAAFLAGFGGFCAAAQVGGAVAESKISVAKYIALRLAAGSLSALFAVLFLR